MARMIKLTKYDNDTDWNEGIPTNKERLSDIYINPNNIDLVIVSDYFIPGKSENSYIPKVMICMGREMEVHVNESMEEVLAAIDPTQGL